MGRPFDDATGDRWVLSLKSELDPTELSFVRAAGNGCRGRWRWLVGCENKVVVVVGVAI